MKAVIELDVPEWQIGQDVTVYFPDTMLKHGKCELLKEHEIVRCKDCEHCYFASNRVPDEQSYACEKHGIDVTPDWYCADGERENDGHQRN